MIEQVRSFNRIVTQSIGALEDRYLASRLPLGEARLVWEIGEGGRDVRELRERPRLRIPEPALALARAPRTRTRAPGRRRPTRPHGGSHGRGPPRARAPRPA